jgi:hypothetical protein
MKMTKTFLLLFFAVMAASVYGQTYPGTPVSNPVRTYTQNDTKGVWVIGNGAPIFSPTAKMSQLYFDYMNQTGYFWNGSAWVAWTNDFLRTASNGLTEDGTDVKLGGALTEPTTIDLDGNDFIIQGTGTMGFDIIGDIALLSTGGVEIRPDGKFEVHTLGNIEVNAAQDIDINTDDVINIQAVNGGSIIADNNDFVLEATAGDVQINSPGTTAGVVNGIAYKSDIANSVAVTDYGINITTGGMADDGKVWTYNGTANEMELVTPMGVDGLVAGTGIAFSGTAPDITISATGDITAYTVTAPITLTGHDIGHTTSGVTPATYGSQTAAAVVTVDATGHVTGATTTTIIPDVNTIGANQLTSGLRDSITLNNWNLLGNTGTLQATNFLGTTDARGLSFRTNNVIRQTIRSDGQVGIGTIDPQSKLDINTNSLGVTQTNESGILLSNTTAAAAGAQQISPALRFRGYGWKTTATAASQSVEFRADILPVQGTTAPTVNWRLSSDINASGTYTDNLTVSSAGLVTAGSGVVSNGAIYTHSTAASSNFYVTGNQTGANSVSNSFFGGSAGGMVRTLFYGNNTTTISSTGNNGANVVFGSAPITTSASGTNAIIANVAVRPLGTITNAGATVTNTVSHYIEGSTTGGTNNYSQWVDAGTSRFDGRVCLGKGANVASATTMTLGSDGNVFHITGTTAITAITTTNWQAGSEITLIFDSTASITAGANMILAGAANFNGTANDVIKLVWDGTSWFEVSRSIN